MKLTPLIAVASLWLLLMFSRQAQSAGTAYGLETRFNTLAEMTPPTVISVNRLMPTAQVISTTNVIFLVTYSGALNGAASGRFQVAPVGGISVADTVTGVMPVGPSVHDVAVNDTSGSGEFRLRMID